MSHPKNELDELLQYLTPQERDELETLATPPADASLCVAVQFDDETDVEAKAVQDYVARNGYPPPSVIRVCFD